MPEPSLARRRSVFRTLWHNGIREPGHLAETTGIPVSTVYRYVDKMKKTGKLEPLPRSGRPRVLSPKKRRQLGRFVARNPQESASELATKLNANNPDLNVTTRTVQRELVKLGWKVGVPKKVPFLTPKHRENRVEWATKHLRQNWRHVVFSDEATFQLHSNTIPMRYKVGSERPQRPMPKHSFKVHVWGAFSAKGPVGFHVFTGIMDGELYRKIITENLFDNAKEVMGRYWVFQQDNDPKHTAKATIKLLNDQRVQVLDWPSNSPDLNPIENLWAIMKRRVEKEVNKQVCEKNPVNSAVFQEIIRSEWNNIEETILLNLVNSMRKRLGQVLAKNGNKINY